MVGRFADGRPSEGDTMSTAFSERTRAVEPERTTAEESGEPQPELPDALAVLRAHPWASLLGAAAVGFLIARLVRRTR
jgi:hypothetical protein